MHSVPSSVDSGERGGRGESQDYAAVRSSLKLSATHYNKYNAFTADLKWAGKRGILNCKTNTECQTHNVLLFGEISFREI